MHNTTKLLQATRLSQAQLAEKSALAATPATWRALCPALTVSSSETLPIAERSSQPQLASSIAAELRTVGYVQTGPLIPSDRVDLMRSAATTMKAAGWPPVFVFVFDEFWELWRSEPVARVLRGALGDDYRMRLWMWCYYVHPVRGARGWPPHADGVSQQGLSVWIPLADSTVENGCIYVVPRDLLSVDARSTRLFERDDVPSAVAAELLQCARPLPAAAGSLLAWQFDVIHWGGVAQGGGPPRISISAEFMAGADVATPEDAPPWIPNAGLPSFDDRLRIIAANLQRFAGNDPWSFKFADLGAALMSMLDQA